VKVGEREVAVTNLDKVFFPEPGLTKGDLIQYYADLAPYVLNHVERRPMQMKRHPNGVEGDFFYQKRVPNPHPDWLETVHISYPSGNEADFPVVTTPLASCGSRTLAASRCTPGIRVSPMCRSPTTCSSIWIRARAIHGSTCARSRWS
jgi:hypothetical protein